MPPRTTIRITEHHGIHATMPAHIGGELDALAVKVVTAYPTIRTSTSYRRSSGLYCSTI
jgi:hypothetical protein